MLGMIRMGIFTDEISQDFEDAVRFAVENDIINLENSGCMGKERWKTKQGRNC